MKVSVCIATYNGEKYIKTQLESILMQLGEEDEVIISDDSSIDKTLDIITKIQDKRIKIYKEKKFKNPISNFEFALSKSSGDIIFLSDQDDLWLDGKIDIMKEYLRKYDLVVSDCYIVDKNMEVISPSFYNVNNSSSGFLKNLYKNSYLGCCMAFNKKILTKALPFPKGIPMHDIWIGMIAETFGNIKFINDKLVNYRRHDNNASSTTEKSKNKIIKKAYIRIKLLYFLMIRYLRIKIFLK